MDKENQIEEIEPREGYIEVPDARLHYLDWDTSGIPTHFLHANGFCAGTYSPFLNQLISDLHIIASDVRGHGDSVSTKPVSIRNWEIFANDLIAVIKGTFPGKKIIGIGHSLGAVTTYFAAAIAPELFAGIVLIDPVILPPRILWMIRILRLFGMNHRLPLVMAARRRRKVFEGKIEAIKRFTAGRGIFKTWSTEFITAYLECGLLEKDEKTAVLKCDPELEAQIFESVPTNVWHYTSKITCPVLAIRGESSDTFLSDAAERLTARISNYTLVTIPNSGHFIPMEKPIECAKPILDFISDLQLYLPSL
ncbi:MAG: alpha/beta hydrolase [Desulfobacterales bacterium]|nr:alpha/beta hydrolase [Desulfobacterales bacterium]